MNAGEDAVVAQRPELFYVDWLRVFLVSLVVAHHAGQAYGPTGGAWPVFEPERTALLGPFFAVNAAFFMGFFFFISGYFVPTSLARKGAARFIRDRLIRLGVPAVVLGFGVFALIGYGSAEGGTAFLAYYRDTYIGEWNVQFGPLWFVLHLLVYSIFYAGLARLFPVLVAFKATPPPRSAAILALAAAIWIIGGVARSIYPQDTWVNVLGVPAEPAHLPQYMLMFAAGTVAGRHGWFESIPRGTGSLWLGVGLAGSVLGYSLSYLGSYGGVDVISVLPMGLVFPLWEALVCVGLIVGLLVYAREHWNHSSPLLSHLGAAAYGVFLIHVFIVVGLNDAFLPVAFPPILKFLIVTTIGLLASFGLVVALRKIPGVARVI